VKVRDLLKMLSDDGWVVVRTRGSHRQLRHTTKPGTVTVAAKPGVDIPKGTLGAIIRQAGLKR
jgi:predicted RNA binding protein YcfA (HicA-like mRNA interferase family)